MCSASMEFYLLYCDIQRLRLFENRALKRMLKSKRKKGKRQWRKIYSQNIYKTYRVRINYRRILQNHIFTNTEQKYMMLLPFEREMSAVS